jgi:hypothetical protein
MRAYEIIPGTTVESIRLIERPAPVARAGQVVIDIRACSLNFRDVINISGPQDDSPKVTGVIPCSDGAGVVTAVGEGVTRLKVGDRVAGAFMPDWITGPMTPEVQATARWAARSTVCWPNRSRLPATGVVKIPEHLSFEEAATLPCAGVTAWYAQFIGGHILPGDTVLLLGTGGVSIFSLQFAKMAGARVILTSSSDEKLERARALGADHVINYRQHPEWQNAVLESDRRQGRRSRGRGRRAGYPEQDAAGRARRRFDLADGRAHRLHRESLDGVDPAQEHQDPGHLRRLGRDVRGDESRDRAAPDEAGRRPRVPFRRRRSVALKYLQSGSHFGKVVISV